MLLFFVLLYNHCYISKCESSLRIYGGRDALRDEFPYAVRIEEHVNTFIHGKTETKIYQVCTGTALTSSWILSAAHCSENNEDKRLFARCNSYFPKDMGYIRPILESKVHSTYMTHPIVDNLYVMGDYPNDVCLFRSEGVMVKVNQYGKLSPVDYMSLLGHEVHTLGYGQTNASELQKPLQVLKGMLYDCNKHKRSYNGICIMPQCGLKTTACGGDSGGPIVHPSGIVGVNSVGEGNCDKNSKYLDVPMGTAAVQFALVSSNVDWISNIIKTNS